MEIKKEIDSALSTEMNRKEFLARSGAALLTLMGAGMVIKSLGLVSGKKHREAGYGSGTYGGK